MPDQVPAKASFTSESVRERETFRYYPLLSSYFRFASDGQTPPSAELTTAPDSVLTALALLGTHQTGTERAFVSLFDATHQYVLAEAAPTVRIAPNQPNDSCPGTLARRGTAIPRNQGTCDHVLYLTEDPDGGEGTELPLSFVPNIAKDSRFSTRPYCQFGEAGQFYAGVPIRTRRGIGIGAYCVMSVAPPAGWDAQSTQCLRDISGAITEHLELKRCGFEARQHERMNRGLGSFVEGKGTLSGWQSGANPYAFMDDGRSEGALNAQQQRLEGQESGATQSPAVLSAPWGPTLAERPSITPSCTITKTRHGMLRRSSSPPPATRQSSMPDADGSNLIFSKAANIMREAFEVEGCVLLSTALGADRPARTSARAGTPTKDAVGGEPNFTGSSSDDQGHFSPSEAGDTPCGLVGFSTTEASSINYPVAAAGTLGTMPRRFLAKLLKQYPQGKIFHFDAVGELQSSDTSDDQDAVSDPRHQGPEASHCSARTDGSNVASASKEQRRRPLSGRKEGALIHCAFPSARSVAFAPVWDTKKERWIAGGFLYTHASSRVFTTMGELSFLLAFSKLVAAEVNSLETSQANKAKSDTLGSLSHELRSPLHGAILSSELLNDTDLSVFQSNAAHTIETCCRTLLDTIDHLLDYSKVNSFAAENDLSSSDSRRRHVKRLESAQFGKKSLYRHTRLDGLVEEVAESVYAGFSFQSMSAAQRSMQSTPEESFVAARKLLNGELAMDHLSQAGREAPWGNLSLYISIDSDSDWLFHVQPGMFRRIVMNLLGNALKYTSKGMVRVSLSQSRSRQSPSERLVNITVQDTGKGISEDYLRHKLFQPFSQEDELAPGTGLGLSLVKKIASQLGGRISVESEPGVGTAVAVTLPLRLSSQGPDSPIEVPDSDRRFEDHVRELAGLRVRLCGFGPSWSEHGRIHVEDICRRWLRLELSISEDTVPDIIIRSEDTLPDTLEALSKVTSTPNVVVCRHAPAARQLSTEFENVNQDRVFEFVAQPIGPRALARSTVSAVRRWAGLPKLLSQPRPQGPPRARSSYAKNLNTTETKSDCPSSDLPQIGVDWAPSEGNSAAGPAESEIKSKKKYLLVDDNSINLKVLSAFMKKLGQAYELATNGQEAVNAYAQDPATFAGILMDISMPIMDGLEATRQIRAFERKTQLQAVAILALTGLASHRTHQEALESGVDVFLTKPVNLKVLSEALQPVCLRPP